MIYPDNFEQKIGIDTIRQFITEKCLSPLGEEQVTAMTFSTDYATIEKWLEQTSEFTQIIRNREDFPTNFFLDVRSSISRIEKDITVWFSEEEISDLMNSLQTINDIVTFLHSAKTDAEKSKYPALTSMADNIKVFPLIVDKANSILDKSCQVKDNASRRLADIRRDKLEATKAITRNMQTAMRDAQKAGLIGRDTQLSVRDGRMMIPVGAANKRKIKGTVHEGSGSGKTVYIEPEAVVEASNRLKGLEADERREVIKILITFTDLVRPHIAEIVHSYRFMGEIDFIRAKASFAVRINGIKPTFENKQQVEWKQAIHPLLNIQLLQQRKQAYPLDIILNQENRLLIVSGANAGGKSLCLKTVALLQYMLQCGLLIPVHESSRTGMFEHIFVDIGDGQSIENSLSTYTSHLTNMKFFVENCDSKTLILIDEFGSGTEPQIGGAIAETLLDRFNNKHSFGIITTHFQNLKHFAYETDGIINGAMLYDAERMQPLYRLSIGNPGSSFAVEVARRIGLPEDIIIDSSAKIGEDFINMDHFLQSIARDKIYWEDKRKEIDSIENQSTEKPKSNEVKSGEVTKVSSPESLIIEKGDCVRLNGQTAVGSVLEIQGKQAIVAFGMIKSTVALGRLELVSKGNR
ncbi:endonuclease MutS2 [Bacteroides sp. 214]|uniref:endonuclease MutS2 n=1 Tax=Bacteroides sp. 214 TaxID=2302935 RepID=UPI0013D0DB99|nr:endonuclease MutS2 [Bacteroides sp. 214]